MRTKIIFYKSDHLVKIVNLKHDLIIIVFFFLNLSIWTILLQNCTRIIKKKKKTLSREIDHQIHFICA